MGIRFDAGGRQGTLDVVAKIKGDYGPDTKITGVKAGLVNFTTPDGAQHSFALGHWAEENQAMVVDMDGFNTAETALDEPPTGLNYFDQSVFFNDGMDMDALKSLYPRAETTQDGRVVVLDSDGLWKTMWSPTLRPPELPLTPDQEVYEGLVNDPRLVMRTAGVTFMLAMAGIEAKQSAKGFKAEQIMKAFGIFAKNCPAENRMQLGKLIHQTTGLKPEKFKSAILDPDSLGKWLKIAQKANSFQFRMQQLEVAEKVVAGLRAMAMRDFQMYMSPIEKLPETKKLVVNMKQMFAEFVQMLAGLDLLRDISRSTGLQEWVSLSQDAAYDPSKLPEMPGFVGAFVQFLRVVMKIVEEPALQFARGRKGLKAIIHIMNMIDECIYSLAGVPDSSAKYKMFMALKKIQTQIETKLAFHYHPDPLKDRKMVQENPFQQAKEAYTPKRETLYKLCQLPRESWNNTLLESLYVQENIEQYYDSLPKPYARMLKEFAVMDVAYDIQPWVDVNHAERTHDAFSEYQESFGLRPPEAGYLAKNSPRAVQNIAETLIIGSAMLNDMDPKNIMQMLRNPFLMAQMIKTLMTASVNRELGIAEVLGRFGMVEGDGDSEASPNPSRIWDDPDVVRQDNQRMMEEIMGEIAIQQAQQQKQQQAGQMQEQQAAEQMRGNEKAGKGPAGPVTARGAA